MKPKFFPVEVGTKIRMVDNGSRAGKLIGQTRQVVQTRSADFLTREVLADGSMSTGEPCYHQYPKASEYFPFDGGYEIRFPFPDQWSVKWEDVPETRSERVRYAVENYAAVDNHPGSTGEEIRAAKKLLDEAKPENVDILALDSKWNPIQRRHVPDFMRYEFVN